MLRLGQSNSSNMSGPKLFMFLIDRDRLCTLSTQAVRSKFLDKSAALSSGFGVSTLLTDACGGPSRSRAFFLPCDFKKQIPASERLQRAETK